MDKIDDQPNLKTNNDPRKALSLNKRSNHLPTINCHIYIYTYIYSIHIYTYIAVTISTILSRDKRRQAKMNAHRPYPCRVDGNTAIKRGLCP